MLFRWKSFWIKELLEFKTGNEIFRKGVIFILDWFKELFDHGKVISDAHFEFINK
jgi:hypothetical protein